MSVKSNVLKTLEERRGSYFSGEQLAEELQVSRSAVWKAIRQLEKEGYEILASTNRGYCLAEHTDLLSEEGIRMYLPQECRGVSIHVMQEAASTNTVAKQAAAQGAQGGSLFVAEQQTAGRGRRGRSFVAVPGGTISMSLLIRPELAAEEAVLLTTAACVAVHRAIRAVTGIVTDIKWVNDLYYQGKKVCGILTEAVTDCETGVVDSVVLGIGINFNIAPDQFPEELRDIAGALYDGIRRMPVTRNQLIAEVVAQIMRVAGDLRERTFLEEYRERSMLIGKHILVLSQQEPEAAVAVGISSSGGLEIALP
ncbi:MAG: biotin--[acetyl-CoA-carboxylase] ligase, partial [Lachnospiraceae bacterium]|nr:biotin--[acetyl-CoA-carboxylase] ligase [Lachnospiraceae bacterium]